MSPRTAALALAAAVVLAALSPAIAYHGSATAADHDARKRAYAECDLRLSHLPKYRGWPQRYLPIEGCVRDLMRRR
jgi:hypothetical protein